MKAIRLTMDDIRDLCMQKAAPMRLGLLMTFWVMLAALGGCTKITAPEDLFAPESPVAFSLLGGGDGEVHFRWARNTEPDFDKYRIYRSEGSSGSFVPLVDLRQNEYVDRFLEYDNFYYYYITSLDFAGNESSPSQVIDVQPLNISSPPAPVNLIVTGANNPNLSQLGILLSWTPPNVSDVLFFRIYRDVDKNFTPGPSNQISQSTNSSFLDQNVQAGNEFYYRIIAEDRGAKVSAPSETDGDKVLFGANLITPANQTVFRSPFVFTWSTVDKALNYQMFIGTGPFSDIIWSSGKTASPEAVYNGPAFQSNRIYYWWVGAYSKDKITTQSGAQINADVNAYSVVGRFFVE